MDSEKSVDSVADSESVTTLTTPKPHASHRNPLRGRPDGCHHPATSTASDNYLKLRSDAS